MPTIGIDARKYFDLGIGTYIQNLTYHLSLQDQANRYVMFVQSHDRPRVPSLDHWKIQVASFRKYSVSEFVMFAGLARQAGVDLFHSPHYTLPFRLKSRSVVTIHDLIPLRFPEYFSSIKRGYAYSMMSHAVRSADAVITVSAFTKKDVLATFQVDPEKVRAIHNGVHPKFCRLEGSREVEDFKGKYRIGDSCMILYVGSVKPHKNVEGLLQAFSRLIQNKSGVLLALAGEPISMRKGLPDLVERLGVRSAIRELGRLTDDELVLAYNAAAVVVMPSLYEGFGLPVLEAMACGTPVIASNIASLPEIVEEGGILVDPLDIDGLRASLERILEDDSLRQRVIDAGLRQATKFSWKDTAAKTLEVYHQVMHD
jgi:hypothetical protein